MFQAKSIRLLCVLLLLAATSSHAQIMGRGRLIYRGPTGPEATDYSGDGGGLGLELVVPTVKLAHVAAFDLGADWVSFGDEVVDLDWSDYHELARQHTTQSYLRLYVGGELGGHSHGFLRPHVGADFALVGYWYSRKVEVWDDQEQDYVTEEWKHFAFRPALGVDASAGLEFNFNDHWMLDFGFRYLRSLFLPMQLGPDAVTIYPQYTDIYVGIGLPIMKPEAAVSPDSPEW
jgi:hypothetical protein